MTDAYRPAVAGLVMADRQRLADLRALRSRIQLEIDVLTGKREGEPLPANRKKRSRHVEPACGTETAYQRHIYRRRKYGETFDGDACGCTKAHAAHETTKRRQERLDKLRGQLAAA